MSIALWSNFDAGRDAARQPNSVGGMKSEEPNPIAESVAQARSKSQQLTP
jgi:hypothetical protein